MQSLCVEVPVARGEDVRRTLQEMGFLRKDLQIEREGDLLYIPITASVGIGYRNLGREFRQGFTPVQSYRGLVSVPSRLEPLLPKAFDSIGDIAILRLPEELLDYETRIGNAILRWSRKFQTVAVDEGVTGEHRIRKVRVIAGEPRVRTEHIEYGIRYLVDVERAYFSPRLGTERQRVARQVLDGETVVDMFAGVGPWAILIARTRRPKTVHAIDANCLAVGLLRENVRRNRADAVVVHEGRGEEVLPRLAPVNRVIMDLPQSARDFLGVAAFSVRRGGVVHYYTIAERGFVEDAGREALEIVTRSGRMAEIAATRIVRGYSPGKVHLAIDLGIT